MLEYPALVLVGFMAGLIDAAVGGGGLVQLPGLFAILPNAVPATLFGTNKLASICGTTMSSWRYARSIDIAWRVVLPTALMAFVFSFAGASAVSLIPKQVMRPLVLALLILMLFYTLHKKEFGQLHRPAAFGKREMRAALLIGSGIGFYDGFFGPGTGSFLIFLFIRFFGFDFLRASGAAKFVNLATNLGALLLFIPKGSVLYQFALPMAAAQIAGSLVGARLAVRGGATLIRKLFIGIVLVLIAKLAWDAFH
jgi:uncharacterized membrane protein YfcA